MEEIHKTRYVERARSFRELHTPLSPNLHVSTIPEPQSSLTGQNLPQNSLCIYSQSSTQINANLPLLLENYIAVEVTAVCWKCFKDLEDKSSISN